MTRKIMKQYSKDNNNVSHERWLVSYADFITLLFGFFVIMYAVSQVNEAKYKVLSETLKEVFASETGDYEELPRVTLGQPPKPSLIEPETPQEAASGGDRVAPDGNPADEMAADRFEHMGLEFKQLLEQPSFGDMVSLRGNEEWLEIEIKAGDLFDSGKASPNNRAVVIFSQLGKLLSSDGFPVRIEGHTDNQPISNSQFASNWELSAARAASIVKLLAEQGVKPHRMAAVGYGEYQPVASNGTEAGRLRNRRVVLMIAKTGTLRPNLRTDKKLNPMVAERVNTEQKIQRIELQDGGILFTDDPQRAIELQNNQDN